MPYRKERFYTSWPCPRDSAARGPSGVFPGCWVAVRSPQLAVCGCSPSNLVRGMQLQKKCQWCTHRPGGGPEYSQHHLSAEHSSQTAPKWGKGKTKPSPLLLCQVFPTQDGTGQACHVPQKGLFVHRSVPSCPVSQWLVRLCLLGRGPLFTHS